MKFDGAAFKKLEGLNVGITDFLPYHYECLGLILGVFPSRPHVRFIAVWGKAVGVGLNALAFSFLVSVSYYVSCD